MVQQRNRLYRSRDDRILFGVAGGLAEFFDIDPVLVRLGWVLLTVASAGIGALAYIVMAIVTPNASQRVSREVGPVEHVSDESSEQVAESSVDEGPPRRQVARNIFGVGLIIVGVIVLLGNLGVFDSIRWDIVWPAIIVALGVAILLPSIRR